MLNPSTADAEFDDATIRRCMSFAVSAGYGGIVVGNLFAWRATKPDDLKVSVDPVGPDNDAMLRSIIASGDSVVCAWGNQAFAERDAIVLDMIRNAKKIPYCLGHTKKGHPRHPLYVSGKRRPIPLVHS